MGLTNVLLASHGTPGAQAAEAIALEQCVAGGTLYHLIVVPDLWRGMMGDDWLNNASTRIRFGEYLEGELSRELGEHQDRVADAAARRDLEYLPEVRQGDPADCLLQVARETDCGLVVIGAPRPKSSPGLRSRVRLDPLLRELKTPLLVVPHPGD